jgi:hypothetical protein
MKPDKRILIVYFSLGGNTERVATNLAARLGADVEKIQEQTPRRGLFGYLRAALDSLRERPALIGNIGRRAADYDLTIVGTPIWAGKITPAVRTYLATIRGTAKRVAFFITSGSTDIARVLPALEGLVASEAIASVGFTESQLKDAAVYRARLDIFIAALSVTPIRSGAGRGLEHAHA